MVFKKLLHFSVAADHLTLTLAAHVFTRSTETELRRPRLTLSLVYL